MAPIVVAPLVSVDWQWFLIDADGTEHACNGELGVSIEWGPGGLLMPPVSVIDRELPLKEGSQLLGVRIGAREFELPLFVQMQTHAGLVNRHEELLSWLDPLRGSIRLKVRRPDSTYRELTATYLGGLEGDEVPWNGVDTWWRGLASFRAHSPYWCDVDETIRTYAIAVSGGTWFPMTFPIYLAGSQVFVNTTENNTGTAETYPRFTLTGPGTAPVVRNLTTGHHFGLDHPLGSGEQAIIDMAPLAELPVRDGSGNNLFGSRIVGSERWALAVGMNNVQVEMANATSASAVTMAYRRRWQRR